MYTIVSNGSVALITVAFIVFVYFVNFWWKRRRLRELGNKIPGPKALPFLGNITDMVGWTMEETLQKYLKVASLYIPTLRIWIGPRLLVVVSDPVDLENLMNNHKCLGRDGIKDLLDKYPLGDGLFLLGGEKWKYHRKVIVPTFHYNILTSFVEIFNRNAKILVKNLREGGKGRKPPKVSTF
uniref:Cytochrome P450 n=1 Tax=Timema cristinae TaxID=61476 RepID=A0A7R9HH02_TIMCR|nr:unnamed protein product [Timema cristinae]